MLKRKIFDQLHDWKQKSNGQTALLIDGARRVGKSYITKAFAEQEYKSYIIIDFGNTPHDILNLFVNESYDLDLFFAKLSAFYSTLLYRRDSLIIFDEVQQFPRARQLIKYLVEDGRYDYIETGSLIRLKKTQKISSSPPKKNISKCIQWILRNFFGRWAMRQPYHWFAAVLKSKHLSARHSTARS